VDRSQSIPKAGLYKRGCLNGDVRLTLRQHTLQTAEALEFHVPCQLRKAEVRRAQRAASTSSASSLDDSLSRKWPCRRESLEPEEAEQQDSLINTSISGDDRDFYSVRCFLRVRTVPEFEQSIRAFYSFLFACLVCMFSFLCQIPENFSFSCSMACNSMGK
jgi:hypothetical protein